MNTTQTPQAPFEQPADLEFQQRQWTFERRAGVALASLVVLAALGLFGSGPLNGQRVQTANLEVEYGRFLRRDAPNQMRLTVRPTSSDGFTLSLDRTYLEHNHPESIEPDPSSTILRADHQEFYFDSNGPGPFVITLRLRPSRTGPISGTLRLERETAVAVSQFVYP